MTIDGSERVRLEALADVLIPAAEGFPSAAQAGVAREGLDLVLSFRPDLLDPLKTLLGKAEGRDPCDYIAHLKQEDPAAFSILAEIVPGAYFLNPLVRAKLGYEGQSARPIDPRPDYLDDGLLQSVIARGPIYRPTPPR